MQVLGFFAFVFLIASSLKLLLKPLQVGRAGCGRQGSKGSAAEISLSEMKLPKTVLQPLPEKPATED